LVKHFYKEFDDKSLTILSIYGLQPFLAFWGLMQKPIDAEFLNAPFLFFSILAISFIFIAIYAKFSNFDLKDKSILLASPIIGNTGNLGIPFGIMLFGEWSAFYTNAINIVNVFLVYTFGVFLYSRGDYSIKESIINIAKIPVIWVAFIAILLNLSGVTLLPEIDASLKMGAYASMVIQLILFGIFLKQVSIKTVNIKLAISISSAKIILIPIIAITTLYFADIPSEIKAIILLETIVPLALTNAALSSLYNCKQNEVTAQILISSVIFIFVAVIFANYYTLL